VRRPAGAATRPAASAAEFESDFMNEIVPYIEKHYRVLADRPNRAVGGLSMGGGQSLMLAINHPTEFAYVGVFSAGLFQRNAADWEKEHEAQLSDDEARKGLKLFWFKTGHDDFLMPVTKSTVELLKRRRFDVVFEESPGGHTWMNWRDYLPQFATQLFR
jgi:enterochelin esterase-like enzyme